jgi:hypothetical protein
MMKQGAFAAFAAGLLAAAHLSAARQPHFDPAWSATLDGASHTRTNVGIPGRMDHMAFDPKTGRLFVAALENGTLEVIDVRKQRRIGTVTGLSEPQGVALVSEQDAVAVSCGGDGRLRIYDTRTLALRKDLEAGEDADNLRVDEARHRLFVAVGDLKSGALAEFDTRSWTKWREIPFSSHPESFQLDPDGDHVYANIPGGVRALNDGVVAFARRSSGAVESLLPLPGRGRNFPMALDAARHRLYLVSRRPARLIVIDLTARRITGETTCGDDSDDLSFDPRTHRLFLSSGGYRADVQSPEETSPWTPPDSPGRLDLFDASAGDIPILKATSPTARHARTSLWIPSLGSVFVAIPIHDGKDPEVLCERVD